MDEADDVRVVDNPQLRRYEAILDGEVVGFSEYRPVAGRLIFTHTEVDQRMEGRGIGSRLVRGLLEDVKQRAVPITVHCPFIRAYLRRHPEYGDLASTGVEPGTVEPGT